jgi:imidazolonepropionase-like amidohydrolase
LHFCALGYYGKFMRPRAALLLLSISLCACQPAAESHMKAIVGAVLIDGRGGPPLSDSVVVVAGGLIREAGARSTVAIPAEADKVDGSGRFLLPALLDVYAKGAEADNFTPGHPDTVEAARAQVARLAGRKTGAVQLWKLEPAVSQAVLEAAREAAVPVVGHISTQAEVRFLVDGGAAGFVGMIADTEDLDPALVARLRDLRLFFAPALAAADAAAQTASRNTQRLFAAGVPVALASNGSDPNREAEALVAAGIPPLDAIVAATRNSAGALGQLDQAGTVEAGKRADLLLLSANPGEDIANLRKVVLRMSAGDWVK